jgi:hypothetical protein
MFRLNIESPFTKDSDVPKREEKIVDHRQLEISADYSSRQTIWV